MTLSSPSSDPEDLFINCACSSSEHVIRFTYWPEDKPEDTPMLYVHVFLPPERNLLKRIWHGMKYIFGYTCKYGYFDETLIGPKEAKKLISLLEKITAV